MNYSQQFQSLIDNPEKSLFGFKDMSEEKQKAYSEAFYMQHPAPKNKFDEYGLRYDIDYLGKIGSDIVLCPVEFMANYVDMVTKSKIDSDVNSFVESMSVESMITDIDEEYFTHLNATSLGNMAYAYLHTIGSAKQSLKEMITKVFIWKANQYKKIIDSLSALN